MDAAPRLEIGKWPTPVVLLPRVTDLLGTEVWAKLEDGCGTWGGNKVRKLEYILARARSEGIDRLVAFGAGTSNWTSALALHAANAGFGVEVRLTANDVPEPYERLYRKLGTRVVRRGEVRWYLEANQHRIRRSPRGVRYVSLGGSTGEGDLGSLHAGEEVADAVARGELPAPRNVFVAVGTAGTAAGLAVGAERRRLALDVVCVRVGYRPYGTPIHVAALARRLRRRLEIEGRPIFRLHGDGNQAAPGYALPNPRSLEAAQLAGLDGLVLDQSYGAKAFASLVAAARRGEPGPLLFLHTSPGDPPPETIAR